MERGVTVLKAQGWFTRRDRSVLLILLTRQELSNLSKVVNAIDPKAFLSVSAASGVYGEGFEQIKTGKLKLDIKTKKQQ